MDIRRRWSVATLVVAWALTVAAMVVFVRSTLTGYDITDEGFYLYAADPANKAYVANGLWGMYLGVLYRAVDYSVVAFRIAGGVLLAAGAGWLGRQAAGLLGHLTERPLDPLVRPAMVASTTASAFLYYALMLRTPSYNWLALLGLMLAVAGAFDVVTQADALKPRLANMILISVGCFLAFWGRNVAGVVVWLLLQLVVLTLAKGDRRARLKLLGTSVSALIALAAIHSILLLDPITTVESISRAQAFYIDHGFSESLGGLLAVSIDQILDAPRQVIDVAGAWILLGFAPASAWFVPASRRRWAATVAACGAFLAVGVAMVAEGHFDGGPQSYEYMTPAVLALTVTAMLAWASSAVVRRLPSTTVEGEGLARRHALTLAATAGGLVVVQVLYAFTSNNVLLGQMSGASVLGLLGAQMLLVAAVGRDRLLPAVLSMAILAPLALGACLLSGRQHPYRDAPLDQSDTVATINRHGAQILVTPATAAYLTNLVEKAKAAGFVPGTPLMDLGPFKTGVPEILGATAPTTLIFGNSSGTAEAARWVLSQQDRATWRKAWVLLSKPDGVCLDPAEVVPAVGLAFPADYELVAAAIWPWTGEEHQIWRPRA